MMNKEQEIKEWFEKRIKHFNDNAMLYRLHIYKLSNKDFFRDLLLFIDDFENIKTIKECSVGILVYVMYLLSVHYDRDFSKTLLFLKKTLIKKNRDYGSSFDKSINKFGWIYVAIELDKKKNRLHSLLKNKEKPNYESVEDTLLDIAGYCVLSLIYLENKEA